MRKRETRKESNKHDKKGGRDTKMKIERIHRRKVQDDKIELTRKNERR